LDVNGGTTTQYTSALPEGDILTQAVKGMGLLGLFHPRYLPRNKCVKFGASYLAFDNGEETPNAEGWKEFTDFNLTFDAKVRAGERVTLSWLD